MMPTEPPDALSSAAAGMRLQSGRLDLIACDLANASTIGYQSRADASFGAQLTSASGSAAGATTLAAPKQGALRRSGSPTDLALVGRGWFSIATDAGVRYTRDGRFAPSGDGSLVDARGNRVLGTLGPICFPRGARIESDGHVVAGGRVVDRLRVVDIPVRPDDRDLAYVRGASGEIPVRASATVHAGYLEESTVDPIAAMTALIGTQRAFEADQKAAQRADESLRKAVTDVPAVRP